jgi:Flp pilus assembly pilin Flp
MANAPLCPITDEPAAFAGKFRALRFQLNSGPNDSDIRFVMTAQAKNMLKNRRDVVAIIRALLRDDRGGEVLEYALIAGLIIIAAIATITAVGGSVLARWSSVQNSL